MSLMDPSVVAVVVNHGTPALTIACVESLLASRGGAPRVVIVDNASPDDSVERLRAAFTALPDVVVHARSTNDGYAGGNDAGIEIARAIGARWAFVLNSDTTIAPDCLPLLLEAAGRDERIALACPRIFFGDQRTLLWFGGGRFSLFTGRPVHVGHRRRAVLGFTRERDLPYASGCALLVRLDALGDEPPFDRSLFAYAEDLDLSLRLRRAGWRIRYVPDALVWHHEGASHRKAGGQALRFYLNTRNLLRVNARHARWYHWPTLAPMLLVDVVGRFCAVTLRDRDLAAFAAVLRGAWHAVSGGRHPVEGRGSRAEGARSPRPDRAESREPRAPFPRPPAVPSSLPRRDHAPE